MKPRTSPRGTAAAPLLYLLLVVCGLAGITWLQFDARNDLVALWAGSLVGVALGQLLAFLRVRAWIIVVATIGSLWFLAPLLMIVFSELFGNAYETAFLALLPAAVCGYLSLSERAGLVAFWYPTVLWMLVILDGPPGPFDAKAALPFALGLAALFVAFFRARETRRVALWCSHSDQRLAAPLPRTVLRTSPLRAAAQLAWTGAVGGGALVLATWIAPSLWQKERAKHETTTAPQVPGLSANSASEPCDPPSAPSETRRERIREYLPLRSGKDAHEPAANPHVPCPQERGMPDGFDEPMLPTHAGMLGGSEPADLPPAFANTAGTATGEPMGAAVPSQFPSYTPTTSPTPVPTDAPIPPPSPAQPQAKVASTSAPQATSVMAPPKPATPVFVPKPAAGPLEPSVPWDAMLALSVAGLGLYVGGRALRRQLTLRHLATPFWSETIDQRISNHWQRMLIGLRDAGIHPRREEQPQAFARRIGIDGMTTCATILERVRHGVRVDAADLDQMHAASSTVYVTARERAGALGCVVSCLRWPLA